MKELDSRKFACLVAKIMDEKQGKDIEILHLGTVSVISDYFVICSATSSTQVRAIAGNIHGIIKKLYERFPQKEEIDTKRSWSLLDYGDVVVHIMYEEERKFYGIEKFWSHACKINEDEWQEETKDMDLV